MESTKSLLFIKGSSLTVCQEIDPRRIGELQVIEQLLPIPTLACVSADEELTDERRH